MTFDTNLNVKRGESLPVMLNFGLKLVPAEPPSPLLFDSPSKKEQPLREEAMELRERHLKAREQALLNDQEKEISEDMEVLDHNRQMLEEWRELLKRKKLADIGK